jgi:hypothetical protein
MGNDVLTRAGRALEPAGSRDIQPAGRVDPAKGRELLARATAAIAPSPKQQQTLISEPPRVERVRLPMTCSARGVSYVVIAERRGDELRFVGHEFPPPGSGRAPQLPGLLSGQYQIETTGWACPLCASNDVWSCSCGPMNGALHCCGTAGGRSHCACGKFESRELVTVDAVDVRGAWVAARAGQSRQDHPHSQLRQISYEPTR